MSNRSKLAAAIVALALSIVGLTAPASAAAPTPWLDQIAVAVSDANGNVVATYTERQVGVPGFAPAAKRSGGVTPNVVYWGCPSGIGCLNAGLSGGTPQYQIAFGVFGGGCYDLPGSIQNTHSSGSSDYGSGLDLDLYKSTGCWGVKLTIFSSHSANFSGPLAGWDNEIESHRIFNE